MMRNIIKLSIYLSLLFTALSCDTKEADRDSIQATFNLYKNAILQDKGEEAWNYVDSNTRKYYGDILDKVKNGDSLAVDSLSMLDRLMVFTIRHRVSRSEIMSFDGKGLLVYAVKNGMVGKDNVAIQSIGDVELNGDFAIGKVLENGKPSPVVFHFNRESPDWKIDLTSLFDKANIVFGNMAAQSGMSENQYIFSILGMLTGKTPGPELWIPAATQ